MILNRKKNSSEGGKKNNNTGGFAMLVFVMIMAISILVMMIGYTENQKRIADNVREIIKTERGLQGAFLCAGYISRTLARYPLPNEDIVSNVRSLSISKLDDENNWVNNANYNNYNQSGAETFDCSVVGFDSCERVNGGSNSGGYDYRAIIEGHNTFNNQDEGNSLRIYIEWRAEEYRFYISKLRLINNFIFSLEFL